MIVVSVAGFVFLRNLALRQASLAEATTRASTRALDSTKPLAEASKVASPAAEPAIAKSAAVPAAPKIPAPIAAAKSSSDKVEAEKSLLFAAESAKTASNRSGRLLESVGSLCAVQLYQSYLNVGLLADAVEHDTYTKADAGQILGTIVTLSQTVDGQLQKLAETGLDHDDSTALDRVRKASALVRTQAMHLQTFWNSGEKSHIDDYQRVRQQCWQELRSILGLPEEKE